MITKLLVDGFMNLMRTGKYSDDELKQILTMLLSDEADLIKLMKIMLRNF